MPGQNPRIRSFLSSHQILSSLKIFAMKKVKENLDVVDYWPSDLLDDLIEELRNLSLSFGGRGINSYIKLWNKNSIARIDRKKQEKLEYE